MSIRKKWRKTQMGSPRPDYFVDHIEYAPTQDQLAYLKHRRDTPRERNLWRAVLRDAIQCYQGNGICAETAAARELLRKKAANWLLSLSNWPKSFRWVCKHIDLDPEAVLNRLESMEKITIHYRRKEEEET
jgi:hypothetical protein